MSETTYYEKLDVSETATEKEIKDAYKRLAKTYHPDAGGTVPFFRELTAARDCLLDTKRRKNYDDELARGRRGDSTPPRPDPTPPPPCRDQSYQEPVNAEPQSAPAAVVPNGSKQSKWWVAGIPLVIALHFIGRSESAQLLVLVALQIAVSKRIWNWLLSAFFAAELLGFWELGNILPSAGSYTTDVATVIVVALGVANWQAAKGKNILRLPWLNGQAAGAPSARSAAPAHNTRVDAGIEIATGFIRNGWIQYRAAARARAEEARAGREWARSVERSRPGRWDRNRDQPPVGEARMHLNADYSPKVPYRTRAAAAEVAKRQGLQEGTVLSSYLCRCGSWHNGHDVTASRF